MADMPDTPESDDAANPAGDAAAANERASAASGETGEGGPQTRLPAAAEPPGADRPPRAPHLDETARAGVVQQEAPERAIVTRAQRRRAQAMQVNRRQLLRVSFWGIFAFGLTGALAGFVSFFWPRGVQGFGGKIAVSAALVPEAGDDPAPSIVGKFWLSHVRAGEGVHGGFGEAGDQGLLALWWKCPHLGCTVPWRKEFIFEGVKGWFRCPCHGSTYTRAGVRVFGPAPRPMDTMEVTVNDDGSLTVDTGIRRNGNQDNPQRTVPYDV